MVYASCNQFLMSTEYEEESMFFGD